MKSKLDPIPDQPGHFALLCECGYDKRTVLATERFFTCERPVEAKLPACKLMHEFAPLHVEMENRYKEAEAKAFLAENDRKVAEAKAVLARSEKTVEKKVEVKTDEPTRVLPKPVAKKKTTIVREEL